MIQPVILCGGSGTRLWPSSRKAYPKQFIKLLDDETLFQATLKRFAAPEFAAPMVMTADDFRFIATDQAAEIGLTDARVVVEPAPRNTAAAILAAALMHRDAPETILLIAPSDHVMSEIEDFHAAIQIGAEAAKSGKMVTFGVTPSRPETGYGYLELKEKTKGVAAYALQSFQEKPDLPTAEKLIKTGKHLWNAGLFMFRVKDIIAAFEAHASDMMAPCQMAVDNGEDDLGFFRLEDKSFESARSESIDYAVMEKANNIVAVPLTSGWSDLGGWDALWMAAEQDENGVATHGAATALDCKNTFLKSEEDNLHLVGLGLDNIVAVAMRDAVLVADMKDAQRVKDVVAILKKNKVDQAQDASRFHRPWGWYETLCLGNRFQVKRICVKPGGVLSLQSHMHRSEHWIVVAGTAEVTVDETVQLLTENQSVYIPLGAVHRMANPGQVPMFLIEVQTGSYLGEDDIVRYEDVYNRS
jgi:mannose-1-phosphate guanylyltransferase/mannose-6-phosphate isomerase